MEVDVSQGLSGRVGEISPSPGFDPWTVQAVASRLRYLGSRSTDVRFKNTELTWVHL
jgi:hypothetical protein